MSKTLPNELIKLKVSLIQQILGKTLEGIKEKTVSLTQMFRDHEVNIQEITFHEIKSVGCLEIRLWDSTLTCLFSEEEAKCKKCLLFLDDDSQIHDYYKVYDALFEYTNKSIWLNHSAGIEMKIEFDLCPVLSFKKVEPSDSMGQDIQQKNQILYN